MSTRTTRPIAIVTFLAMLMACSDDDRTPEATDPNDVADTEAADESSDPANDTPDPGTPDQTVDESSDPTSDENTGDVEEPSFYEPPINVFVVLHIDPVMSPITDTFRVTPAVFNETRNELDWIIEEAQRHGIRFTALFNGWYPQWALNHGETSQFQTLDQAGHDIGTHAHIITYDSDQDLWIGRGDVLNMYGRPNWDWGVAHQCWDDADRFVDAMLAEIGVTEQNQVMATIAFRPSDEAALLEEFGFSITPGNRIGAEERIGQPPWNPWRPAASDQAGYELQEDLEADHVTLGHLAQVGFAEAHGIDHTVPQIQRQFLTLYVEWLSRERTEQEDKVWTFGVGIHPNYGDEYNEDIVEFLGWLDDNFIGHSSPRGNTVAHYASITEIVDEFLIWEVEHPGVSSFSMVVGDPYPYTYEFLETQLDGAAFVNAPDLGSGIHCFEFSREGVPVYLVWSDEDERTIDFSAELPGQVSVIDAEEQHHTESASTLQLTPEPVLIEPL